MTINRSSSYLAYFTYTHRLSDETGYGGELPEIILIYRLWLTQLYDVTLHVTYIRIAGNRHTICLKLKERHPIPLWRQNFGNIWLNIFRDHDKKSRGERSLNFYHRLSVVYEPTLRWMHYEDRVQIKTTKPIMLDTLISANNAQKCIAYRKITRL